MSSTNTAFVETQLMIRKPVQEVFQAFIDPGITTKFWFTKSTGKLEEGKTVTWEWEMYNVSAQVLTKQIIPNTLIATEWGNPATNVDYAFTAISPEQTLVVIKNYGFNLSGDALIAAIKDSTGGFTSVLDGCKAWLEHAIELNLVLDKFPGKGNADPKTISEWQQEM